MTHYAAKPATASASRSLSGTVKVPGDKSISHRSLIFGALAIGTSRVSHILESEDVVATREALVAMGVNIRQERQETVIEGVGIGGLRQPNQPLNMGNAGTATRLLMGVLAGYPFQAMLVGDASLSKRPMNRVILPLTEMGAQFHPSEGGRLPLSMQGSTELLPIHYRLPVASAQVKSAILLAGLHTVGKTTVIEPVPTRDHTERMCQFFGADMQRSVNEAGEDVIEVNGFPKLKGASISVPSDPSSAAFPIIAALITPDSAVTVPQICMNKTRIGFLEVLQEMGANITIANRREVGGEEVADITARTSTLRAVHVQAARAASMIDEYPILSVAAAYAEGMSHFEGLEELRVKESDRLQAVLDGLLANGVRAETRGDDLKIWGSPENVNGGGTVATYLDHRIAMAFLVLGLGAKHPVTVDDVSMIQTSFPGFMPLMHGMGAHIN